LISDDRLAKKVELELFQKRIRAKEVLFRKLTRDLVFLFFHKLAVRSVFESVPTFSSVERIFLVSSTATLCFLKVS